uniref:Immunoglobulin domain-containing protein n=1 Tax=Gopherus agassizii TaxID=38772 RepID=A0A452GMU8_9SAUR
MACLLPTAEPSYPKPSISLSPSGGVSLRGAVSVWCRGQHQGMRFMLNKEGRHVRTVDSDGSEVVFYISNMSREDGGNYSCSYHSRSEPFAVSYPSDPMELVVTGEGRGPAHGGVSLGAVVTICCEGQHRGVRFVLNKEQRHYPPVDSDGFGAEFLISNVSREDSGNYSCSYHSKSEPFAVSYPSDPVELVVRGEGPGSASLGGVAQGEAVTIWCVCQCLGVRFLLRKGGAMAAHRTTAPAVDVVEFPICNVRRGDAGSYCCRYRTKWDPLISSEPSDPMELAGEGSGLASLLPAPRPSGPSGGLRASLGSRGCGGLRCPLVELSGVCVCVCVCAHTHALTHTRVALPSQTQECNPDTEGPTYMELDHEVLQGKWRGLAPAPEPVLYAAINVSQGPHGQSPCGAGAPPPHLHSVN